jgi:2-dehydropantoate 2-reductase
MRYIVIGAGGVGGTIGGRLAQAGHDVVLVARGPHLDALRTQGGLRLTTPEGTSVIGVPAVSGPDEVELTSDDVLLLAAKTQDAEAALAGWAWQPVKGGRGKNGPGENGPGENGAVAADDLPVLCAQNGVASERLALRRFRHVYGVCVWLPATHLEPGAVEAQGAPLSGLLHVGRYPSGTDKTIERIGAELAASRFLAPVVPDIMRWKHGKLLANLANAIEAVCGLADAGDSDGDSKELRRRVRTEGKAVLDAAGIPHASNEENARFRADQVQIVKINGAERGGGSSWQSLTRGTGSIEADYLLGRELGVPTPVNEVLQRLANRAARERRAPGSLTPAEVLALA